MCRYPHYFLAFAALVFNVGLCAVAFSNREPGNAVKTKEQPRAGADQPIAFQETLLAEKVGYIFGVAAADLDGDGDLDLTSPGIVERKTSTLYWYENTGRGQFKRRIIYSGEPGWFERHAIGDLNNDGKPDVAIVNNLRGELVWFANLGAGKWRRRVITLDLPKAYSVALADLDGDQDLDVAASAYRANEVAWFENPGRSGHDKAWPKHGVDTTMFEARTIAAADVNSDGLPDLIASAVGEFDGDSAVDARRSRVVWYENSGAPQRNWRRHVINEDLPAAVHGQPVDLDQDGDIDVVMAHGMRVECDPKIERHQIVWYENVKDSNGAISWRRRSIGPLPYAFEAVAGDIDGDGDIDVAATAWSKGDRVVWFENTAAKTWKRHEIRRDFRAANQIILADLDDDGRLDIAAGADDGSRRVQGSLELRWWRQLERSKNR